MSSGVGCLISRLLVGGYGLSGVGRWLWIIDWLVSRLLGVVYVVWSGLFGCVYFFEQGGDDFCFGE